MFGLSNQLQPSVPDQITGTTRTFLWDTNGCLHMKITYNDASKKWDCAELYTTNNLGFGTYQWQMKAGLTPSIPGWFWDYFLTVRRLSDPTAATKLTLNTARWGKARGTNGWWTVYPDSGTITGQKAYNFSLDGTYTTSRFNWRGKEIKYWLMGGFQPVERPRTSSVHGITLRQISPGRFRKTPCPCT